MNESHTIPSWYDNEEVVMFSGDTEITPNSVHKTGDRDNTY